jgi:hypothetical protein
MIEDTVRSFAPPAPPAYTASTQPPWTTTCLNCGATIASTFCGDCGQRALPPRPTVRELAGDAFAELSGWDGKFVETFKLLLRKPGELTRQFIDGRRVRFISPVRLYLTVSVVYFLAAAAAPMLVPPGTSFKAGGVKIGITSTGPGKPAENNTITQADRDSLVAQLASAPKIIRPILQRVASDPNGFKRDLYETMPRAMFLLVPLFAAIVGVFYRGRHYPEHLYFALHVHAFAFLALLTSELAKFTHVFALAAGVETLAQLSLPVYAILALRRVYGGSFGTTIAKGAGIGALYALSYGVTIFGVIYWAAVSR